MKLRNVLTRLLIAILLGVMTTILVAWGFVLWSPWDNPRNGSAAFSPRGSTVSSVQVTQAWQPGGLVRYIGYWSSSGHTENGALPNSIHLEEVLSRGHIDASWGLLQDALISGRIDADGYEEARGWPVLALYSSAPHGNHATPMRRGGLRISDDPYGFEFRFLPFFPIWSGLAICTGMYGSLWFLALTVPVLIRSAIRRRKGRCPHCGYDMSGAVDDICSECGWTRAVQT